LLKLRWLTASLLAAFFIGGGPLCAFAGTTGTLRGRIVDANTRAPVANAAVTAVSAAQSVSGKTDAGGNFAFISLTPDSYTVSVQKPGYDSQSSPGNNVFADQSTDVNFALLPSIKTIAQVRSRAVQSLVHPGTTSIRSTRRVSTRRWRLGARAH
jgi:hypothetical protein